MAVTYFSCGWGKKNHENIYRQIKIMMIKDKMCLTNSVFEQLQSYVIIHTVQQTSYADFVG